MRVPALILAESVSNRTELLKVEPLLKYLNFPQFEATGDEKQLESDDESDFARLIACLLSR